MSLPPNIVLIVTDSQGINLLGAYGQKGLHTENIDRLSQESVVFETAYGVCPLCTPARSGLFSGMYPSRNGAWANSMALASNVVHMGRRFQDAGYDTAYVGKWHLDGHDYFGTGEAPAGWDDRWWYDGKNYVDDLSEDELALWRTGGPEAWREAGISAEFTWANRISQRVIDFLREERESPFLVVASYDEPHHPFCCPPEYLDMFEDAHYDVGPAFHDQLQDKPSHQRLLSEAQHQAHTRKTKADGYFVNSPYLACNAYVDDEIGRVLAAVDRCAPSNTLVVFTSDHGDYMGAHKMQTKGFTMYEEATHVPLMVRMPEGSADSPPRRCRTPVTHVDILPTLLDFAGLEVPPALEGRSLQPELADQRDDLERPVFMEFNRFALHQDGGGFVPIRCIRQGSYKLVINLFDTDELYDLAVDPHEINNRINDPALHEIRDDMFDRLVTWMHEHNDPFRGPQWEDRAWRETPESRWGGFERPLAGDGYRPPWRDYRTGQRLDQMD